MLMNGKSCLIPVLETLPKCETFFFQESDFYFMSDPEEFATQCHPEKHQWQLLDAPFTRKEFLNLPNLRPKFFELGMMIVTPKTAFNKAIGAKVSL